MHRQYFHTRASEKMYEAGKLVALKISNKTTPPDYAHSPGTRMEAGLATRRGVAGDDRPHPLRKLLGPRQTKSSMTRLKLSQSILQERKRKEELSLKHYNEINNRAAKLNETLPCSMKPLNAMRDRQDVIPPAVIVPARTRNRWVEVVDGATRGVHRAESTPATTTATTPARSHAEIRTRRRLRRSRSMCAYVTDPTSSESEVVSLREVCDLRSSSLERPGRGAVGEAGLIVGEAGLIGDDQSETDSCDDNLTELVQLANEMRARSDRVRSRYVGGETSIYNDEASVDRGSQEVSQTVSSLAENHNKIKSDKVIHKLIMLDQSSRIETLVKMNEEKEEALRLQEQELEDMKVRKDTSMYKLTRSKNSEIDGLHTRIEQLNVKIAMEQPKQCSNDKEIDYKKIITVLRKQIREENIMAVKQIQKVHSLGRKQIKIAELKIEDLTAQIVELTKVIQSKDQEIRQYMLENRDDKQEIATLKEKLKHNDDNSKTSIKYIKMLIYKYLVSGEENSGIYIKEIIIQLSYKKEHLSKILEAIKLKKSK